MQAKQSITLVPDPRTREYNLTMPPQLRLHNLLDQEEYERTISRINFVIRQSSQRSWQGKIGFFKRLLFTIVVFFFVHKALAIGLAAIFFVMMAVKKKRHRHAALSDLEFMLRIENERYRTLPLPVHLRSKGRPTMNWSVRQTRTVVHSHCPNNISQHLAVAAVVNDLHQKRKQWTKEQWNIVLEIDVLVTPILTPIEVEETSSPSQPGSSSSPADPLLILASQASNSSSQPLASSAAPPSAIEPQIEGDQEWQHVELSPIDS